MDSGEPVSMIESRTHVDHPRKHGRKIFFAFVIIFAVLVTGLLIAATYSSNNAPAEKEIALDDDSDDSEIIVAEIATNSTRVGEAFWRVATESGSQVINRSDCESLIRYGNQYVDAFGGTKLNNTVCQENFIKVAGKQVSSTEYPYDDLMTIYIQTGDKCLVAPFYEGFYGIQGYSVMDGNCAVTVKSVGVIDE